MGEKLPERVRDAIYNVSYEFQNGLEVAVDIAVARANVVALIDNAIRAARTQP